MNASLAPAVTGKHLRPLKWHERVRLGDFVQNNQQGFELWDGPHGFRADAFVKQIYRRLKSRAVRIGKPA